MTVFDVIDGRKFKILNVKVNGEIGKRLSDMGFIKGAEATMVRSALFGDPIEVNLNGCNISLRKIEAQGIEVELLKTQAG